MAPSEKAKIYHQFYYTIAPLQLQIKILSCLFQKSMKEY